MDKIVKRFDGFSQEEMGIGTGKDKLQKVKPVAEFMTVSDSQNWYLSNGFMQNIIDIPAEDSTREWIEIETNKDDLNISRLIQNRLEELQFQRKLKDLIRFSRMYNQGGFLYYGIDHPIPQTDVILEKPIPLDLNKIDYINVFSPSSVVLHESEYNPLSKNYHNLDLKINSLKIHPSRFNWLVISFIPEKNTGVSVIQTIKDAVIAQGISLWSISSILSELSIKVFKSPQVDSSSPEKLYELLALIRTSISSQGVFAAGENESLERLEANVPGLKDIFDYLLENLSGLAKIPKSRLSGQSQGTITGGQYDLISYYDSIAKFQEIELRPILEKAILLIINERQGEIYKRLNGNINSLDWKFDFKPLWKLSETEESDIKLKQSQTDQIYISTAVLSPQEVRSKRFQDLENFKNIHSETIDFSVIPPS